MVDFRGSVIVSYFVIHHQKEFWGLVVSILTSSSSKLTASRVHCGGQFNTVEAAMFPGFFWLNLGLILRKLVVFKSPLLAGLPTLVQHSTFVIIENTLNRVDIRFGAALGLDAAGFDFIVLLPD